MAADSLIIKAIDGFVREAYGLQVSAIFNSIGHMILCGFGESHPETLKTGTVYQKQNHVILLESAAWRIMQGDQFWVGAFDTQPVIQEKIRSLLGMRLLSFEVVSAFFDVCLRFEGGYTLSTFVYDLTGKQWLLFAGKNTTSLCVETQDDRNRLSQLSQIVQIHDHFQSIDTLVNGKLIQDAFLDDDSVILVVNEDLIVNVDIWCWRLEQNGAYYAGTGDSNEVKRGRLKALKGCSIDRVEVANHMMDTRFYIGDYVLSTFVSSGDTMLGWGIYDRKNRPLALYPPEPE